MTNNRTRLQFHPLVVLLVLTVLVGIGGYYLPGLLKGPNPKKDGLPDDFFYVELPEEERTYIWGIENRGNVLNKHGFGPLASALKRSDADAVGQFLSPSFKGATIGNPHRVQISTDFAEKEVLDVERVAAGGSPTVPLSREGFVALLMSYRRIFKEKPPDAKFSLVTLGPKVRKELDGRWEGTAQLRMFGEQTRGAPAEVVLTFAFECAKPTDDSLKKPGWLFSAEIRQALSGKAPRYLFQDVARARGLKVDEMHDNWKAPRKTGQTGQFNPHPGGVYVCDYNRDGILDMLVTDARRNVLYQGLPGGTFQDVMGKSGLPEVTKSQVAAWVDLDGDGWEDLILNGRLFRNMQGKGFEDYTDRSNLRIPGPTMAILAADYDGDGKIDLYTTQAAKPGKNSWLESKSEQAGGNHLFRNKGGWQFEDVTEASGTDGGQRSAFAAAWLDANNDGLPDIHVINEFGDGVLLINNGNGTFSPQSLGDIVDFGSMGVAVGDIDNDGLIDIYCGNMYSKAGTRVMSNMAPDAYAPDIMRKIRRFVAGSQLHLNKGGLKFEQAGPRMQVAAVGWAYGPCLADLDNDGWLDIYATAGFVSQSRDEPDG